jgi:dihydroneopterin triphosphate diphosphatase
MPPEFKIPESVLVVIYTDGLEVLLLERADHPGFWQSVTGSRSSPDEPLVLTALREVGEETGIHAPKEAFTDWQHINRYVIYPHWRHRYAPGVTENTEHVFGLRVPRDVAITLAPREHLRYRWMDWEAAADQVFSWTNAKAIRTLPARVQRANDN